MASILTAHCYFCGAPQTSAEHAPAQSFFPKGHRLNLITVPSCAIHNEQTSLDDEYVRNIIAMLIGNNAVAERHFLDKCLRSLRRSPGLSAQTLGKSRPVYTSQNNGPKTPTTAFSIDRLRVDRVLKKIAYALFYHDFGQPWPRRLNILTEHFRLPNMRADLAGQLVQAFSPLIIREAFSGQNPTVFQYQFLRSESEDEADQLLLLRFYENVEIWITPLPDQHPPTLDLL